MRRVSRANEGSKVQARLLHEYSQHCPECNETTPHGTRRVAIPMVLSAVALVGAGACVLLGGAWYSLAAVLAVVGVHVLILDRRRMWRIRCLPCREKKFVELRQARCVPADTTTYIDP